MFLGVGRGVRGQGELGLRLRGGLAEGGAVFFLRQRNRVEGKGSVCRCGGGRGKQL